jgi:hypothetical protein
VLRGVWLTPLSQRQTHGGIPSEMCSASKTASFAISRAVPGHAWQQYNSSIDMPRTLG